MAAYIIAIRDEPIRDQAEMDIYLEKVMASASDKVTPLAFYGALEALEGPRPDGVVILRFDSVDEARGFYRSEAYQAALPHRLRAADYRLIIVDGL